MREVARLGSGGNESEWLQVHGYQSGPSARSNLDGHPLMGRDLCEHALQLDCHTRGLLHDHDLLPLDTREYADEVQLFYRTVTNDGLRSYSHLARDGVSQCHLSHFGSATEQHVGKRSPAGHGKAHPRADLLFKCILPNEVSKVAHGHLGLVSLIFHEEVLARRTEALDVPHCGILLF
jgi:hypothetical protein